MKNVKLEDLRIDPTEFEAMMGKALGPVQVPPATPPPPVQRKRSKRVKAKR